MGNGVQFPLPGDGGVREGLKKSMALPFRPVGARWPGGKGYGTQREHQGCASEGPGGVGGKVASQLKARSAGRGIGSRGCVHSPPPVESHLVNIYAYRTKRVGASRSKGVRLVTPCSQENVFVPAVLPACFPSPSGHLFCSLMAEGARARREGQTVWGTRNPFAASCVGERGPWAVNPDSSPWASLLEPAVERQHAQTRSWTVIPSSTVFASERLCVSDACRKDYCSVSLQLVRWVYIILGYN